MVNKELIDCTAVTRQVPLTQLLAQSVTLRNYSHARSDFCIQMATHSPKLTAKAPAGLTSIVAAAAVLVCKHKLSYLQRLVLCAQYNVASGCGWGSSRMSEFTPSVLLSLQVCSGPREDETEGWK